MKKKLYKLVKILPIILSFILIMSGVMTYANVGYGEGFYFAWLKSFLVILFIILPIASLFMDKLATWIEKKFKHKKFIIRKMYFAVIMGCVMETIMAIGTTITNNGINSQFFVNWFGAFIVSLPIGIILGFIMGVFVIPRLHKYLHG